MRRYLLLIGLTHMCNVDDAGMIVIRRVWIDVGVGLQEYKEVFW